MSTASAPLPESSPGLANIAVWLVAGAVGAAIFFTASVHLPLTWKVMGAYPVALGAVAGWALGQWAIVRKLRSSGLVMALVWALIAAGEVLAAVETHRAGIKPARSDLKPEQLLDRDMFAEGERQYFSREPEGLNEEERIRWREARENYERGEQRRQEAIEAQRLRRSFYGYLANRIPEEKWGKWSYPWPAVFWGTEVLLASTLGTWIAYLTLRSVLPPANRSGPSIADVRQQAASL
jgi:hypothetical protein